MSTLILSPRVRLHTHLDELIVTSSSILSPKLSSSTHQSLPPLLSRLPPALLASPETLPVTIDAVLSTFTSNVYAGEETIVGPSSILSTLSISPSISHSNASTTSTVGYTESHLPAIDTASLALHYALYNFKVLNLQNYATPPYQEAFNWNEIHLPTEMAREWYIVAFRSVRRKGADSTLLYQADRDAHEEAVTAGGLLLYWYGSPNEKGENLATCIWQSRKHALHANRNAKHAIAAGLASATYESFTLERYVLKKGKGLRSVTVTPWEGGDVGF